MQKQKKIEDKSASKRRTIKEEAKQSVINETENINKILRQSRKFDELRANIRSHTISEPSLSLQNTAAGLLEKRSYHAREQAKDSSMMIRTGTNHQKRPTQDMSQIQPKSLL